MQKNWIEVDRSLLDYVATKYRQSVKASLVRDKLTVTEIDEDMLLRFKTQKDKDNHLGKLELWKQE